MFKSSGMISDIRWKQRFDNFDRAFVLLREVYERKLDSLSRLEKEGAIQRFKVAFELAWKTINDYLEESGVVVNPVTPRNVIKEAFTARLLDDADVWIDMMLHRNLLLIPTTSRCSRWCFRRSRNAIFRPSIVSTSRS